MEVAELRVGGKSVSQELLKELYEKSSALSKFVGLLYRSIRGKSPIPAILLLNSF